MRTFSSGELNRLRNEAKRLKKEKGISHTKALDEIAGAQGWPSWAALAAASAQAQAASESPRQGRALAEPARYYVHGDEEAPGQYYCEFCDRVEGSGHFQDLHAEDAGRRTLTSLESWRKLPLDTKLQYFRPDKAPNLFQALYPAPQSAPKPRVRRSEHSGMFHSWLCEQEWRPDAVGDFARSVAYDAAFPVASDDVELIRRHVMAASAEELDALEDAWEDFLDAVGGSGYLSEEA
jgi:hypothetical protein